jgi:hypothetical protein
LPGMDFSGGFILDGPWGRVSSANITPDATGIDGDTFMQAVTTGHVSGRKLRQIMPWRNYRKMTGEDINAIYAYLKTLKPIKHFVDNTLPATYCKLCRQSHGGGNKNQE